MTQATTDAMTDAEDVFQHGTVLLSGIVGSTAYGLAGPDSDVDRLGMYAAPSSSRVSRGCN